MAPAPGELEGIGEEAAQAQAARARRADTGGFVIGQKREKRFIEPSKYWRVDDKERNKKRKLMTTKMWKGRKKPKHKSLTAEEEVYLAEFIRTKESSSEDSGDEEAPRPKRVCVWGAERGTTSSQSSVEEEACVWSAVEGAEVEEAGSRQVSGCKGGGKDSCETPQAREEAREEARVLHDKEVLEAREASSRPMEAKEVEVEETETREAEVGETEVGTAEVTEVTTESKDEAERPKDKSVEVKGVEARTAEVDDSLASLVGLIPAEELEEMMSGDLLFCGEGGGWDGRAKKGKGARESRGGVRRSARLSTHPSLPSLGSIYTMEDAEVVEEVFEEARVVTPPPTAPPPQGDTPPFLNQVVPLRVAGKSKTKSRLKLGRAGAGVLQDISNKDNLARPGGEERLEGRGGRGRVLEGRGKDAMEKGVKAANEEKDGRRGSGEGGSRRSR